MSLLALLVAVLLALVLLLVLGAVGYLVHRHPQLDKPLSVTGTWAAAAVAAVALLLAVR
ncbi:hypothetical protein ACIRQY_34010 [Streptomyces sp. NPDC101490]|uniref:hypothetical protein n=1 Tax=Streptomyces sp. NPDC101490 TaxID=3366143 RepID=UPI003811BBBE